MTVYRELIERQLAVRQAGLQIGLQKANEQEPFIVEPHDVGLCDADGCAV